MSSIDISAIKQQISDLGDAIEALESNLNQPNRPASDAIDVTSPANVPIATPQATGMSAPMSLTPAQTKICVQVINVFETGRPDGDYGAISIYTDGPNKIRQVTYGRAQTTEFGNLRELIKEYVAAGGQYSAALAPYVAKIGTKVGDPPQSPLVNDQTFLDLLRKAGQDPVMQTTQDSFFDKTYFQPSLVWGGRNGFAKALSALVIYDSFNHSGGMLAFLIAKVSEPLPIHGGNEKTWIAAYVAARQEWLANNDNAALHPTVYRTKDLTREIQRNNWDLAIVPIMANGVPVGGTTDPGEVAETALIKPLTTPQVIPGAAEQGTDGKAIPQLIALGANSDSLQAAQKIAAQRLFAYDKEKYPSDGCAITLSVLLQQAGIEIADTYLAIELCQTLKNRGWSKVDIGQQKAGDVGTTCGPTPRHGTDHIYLVLRPVNADEMVIADNQDTSAHFRFVSGKGRSPTTYFLRAPAA